MRTTAATARHILLFTLLGLGLAFTVGLGRAPDGAGSSEPRSEGTSPAQLTQGLEGIESAGAEPQAQKLEKLEAEGPVVTPAVRDLPIVDPADYAREMPPRVVADVEPLEIPEEPFEDPVWQKDVAGGLKAPAFGLLSGPILDFDGLATGANPHDPVGDVGPNHYVQAVNSVFAVYDKAGALLAGPSTLDSLFAGLPPCDAGAGDPIVLYDHLADRWLISQIAGADRLCVAVSMTPDPTGAYFAYNFFLGLFPDYAKLTMWPDAYCLGANAGAVAYVAAFARPAMLAGAAPASFGGLVGGLPGLGFNLILPGDLDGPAPPAGTFAPYYRQVDGTVFGGPDRVEVFEFDFAGAVFFGPHPVPLAPFDSALCGFLSFSCIPQPGTPILLDPLNEPPMWRLQFRSFAADERLVGSFAVDVDGADTAGVRWFELRRAPGAGPFAWALFQNGTYAPQDGGDPDHRWVSSIAMDAFGNIALGYNTSNAGTIPPEIRYTGRVTTDPLGTMPQGEDVLKSGEASMAASNRWGDYSSLNVDPVDDCTFWYTNDYVDSATGRQSRIGTFRFERCAAANECGNAILDPGETCEPPGGAQACDCCVANGTPGCTNATCESIICALDPFCCNTEWDAICRDEALLQPECLLCCNAECRGNCTFCGDGLVQSDREETCDPPGQPVPTECALFGASFSGPDGLAQLLSINPATGAAAPIGPGIGFQRVSGMDFHPLTGELYATGERDDGSNTNVLIKIDPVLGTGTEIGPTGIEALPVTVSTVTDVSFRADGTLYGNAAVEDVLLTFNLVTGAATLVGTTGVSDAGAGLGFDNSGTLIRGSFLGVHTVNTATGLTTFVAPPSYNGFPPPVGGNGFRPNALDNDPCSRKFYASIRDGGGGGGPNYLATLDTASGDVFHIGLTEPGLDAIAWQPQGEPCRDNCTYCGDGVVQGARGEECDDGNTVSEDGCSDTCANEFCGDGTVQAGLGEACDDGNNAPCDGCNPLCQPDTCGDGFLCAPEACEPPGGPGGSGNLVQDGSFEAGTPNPFWTEFSTNFGTTLCSPGTCGFDLALDGAWWSWFGGTNALEEGIVSQPIALPDGATATLQFALWLITCSGEATDFFEVNVNGGTVFSVDLTDARCANGDYGIETVDLSAFAGQAITLEFRAVTGTTGVGGNIFLDLVSLEVFPNSDCCFSNGSPGCSVAVCEAQVCAIDPFCCNTEWDGICADEAAELGCCPGECSDECCVDTDGDGTCDGDDTCVGTPNTVGGSDCCEANGSAGCTDPACEAEICAYDSFCCNTDWDLACANEALRNATCLAGCGGAWFNEQILALGKTAFGWLTPQSVRVVRGDLADVPTGPYGFDATFGAGGTSFGSPEVPSAGQTLYWVTRPDCPLGSYWSGGVGQCGTAAHGEVCPFGFFGNRDSFLP